MSAEASGAAAPAAADHDVVLQPGMLAGLIERAIGPDAASFDPERSGDRSLPGRKMAQYFPNFPNFFSCVAGFWRRC